MNVTKTLVDYVMGVEYERLPGKVVDMAKTCILDNLGCGLGGFNTELGKVVVEQVKEMGGARESTLIGDGSKVPCAQAAFANSAMINALDYDETYDAIGHPGSTLIPAALAVGERVGASGRDLIASIVSAYEAVIRIGVAIQPSPKRFKEVWFVGTWQTFGAVIAAGKLLGLDAHKMANAFGIAGVTSPLPNSNAWGWDERPLHWVKEPTAWPAHTGVLAAQLAKKGFVGNRSILDGEHGFWIMAGSDQCNFDVMTEGLWEEYKLLEMSFKPYPSCRWTHSTLDAAKMVVQEHHIRPDEIRRVAVKTFSPQIRYLTDYKPKTFVDSEFSIPYTVAMVVRGEEPGPKWYSKKMLENPEVLELVGKVRLEVDPEADKAYFEEHKMVSTVEIVTKDGKRFSSRVEYAKGDPKNPMTKEELKEKFKRLASLSLNEEQVNILTETISRLETLGKVMDLTRLLHGSTTK